jgi:Domain of unknown function (DUF4136)
MKALKGLLILAVMTAACSTLTVSSDWDHTANFSNYQTYAMREGTKAKNPLIQDRIDRSLTQTLQLKGLRMDAQNPQLLVYTHVRVGKEQQVNYNTYGYGGWYGWGGWGPGGWSTTTATVSEVPVGTLIVDLVDSQKKSLVWRGTASDTITSQDQVSQENIDKAVSKMFDTYPPKPGK